MDCTCIRGPGMQTLSAQICSLRFCGIHFHKILAFFVNSCIKLTACAGSPVIQSVAHGEKTRQICKMRNGNDACLTTTFMISGHRSKLKAGLA